MTIRRAGVKIVIRIPPKGITLFPGSAIAMINRIGAKILTTAQTSAREATIGQSIAIKRRLPRKFLLIAVCTPFDNGSMAGPNQPPTTLNSSKDTPPIKAS